MPIAEDMVRGIDVSNGFDFYHVFENFATPKQLKVRDAVRDYMENEVKPHINDYWERAEFPMELFLKARDIEPHFIGGIVRGRGAAGLDPLEAGLVAYEMARVDGSIGTAHGVHTALGMTPIAFLGNDEQRDRWLPRMANLELIGAFGLTEPARGSAATDIQTTARKVGSEYVLNGAKRWIGNAAFAGVLIIWARDENGDIGGFVIEHPQEVEGVTIENIQGKIAKRAVMNADITLQDVVVPAATRLPKVRSFQDIGKVLLLGRIGVAWEAAGLAEGLFTAALEYAREREQFGKRIAEFQLIQDKLVEMATEVTLMQMMCFQLASMTAFGQLTPGVASMAKYNNARKARRVAALARETLGGNGIVLDYHVARLFTDAEATYTYEGTNEIQTLIVGREITGYSAFV
ncbi:MAG: acyl-CoA dehydrogenase [Chloroflexi bacterium]|nr:acyl-CoA dehydrogenase [Chloroflexota bacterium]